MGSEVNGILVAAHELKAPVSLMRQLALSLKLTDSVEIQDRITSQMIHVSERAMSQLNDLAKISRLEEGLFTMEPVSVRGVCESVLRDINPLFGYDQKALSIKYKNRHKLAVANSELLYSIIYNFCTNAMHYSDSQTISQITVSDTKNQIRINVRDYGPALPKKVWLALQSGKVSQPMPTSMRPDSSGLGLYIASKFSEYMHASLGAIRHRDGTSFFIELPISNQVCLFK